MEYVKALEAASLPAGAMARVEVKGKEILIANVAGSYYAVADKCPHMGGSLAGGKLDGATVICPKHGASFDVTSGQSCGNARIAFLSLKVKPVECYAVKVEDGSILVGTL